MKGRKKVLAVTIDEDACMEIRNIACGAFAPLQGFMDSADYHSVVHDMHLASGDAWTLPVTLDVPEDLVGDALKARQLLLRDTGGRDMASIIVEDIYKINKGRDVKQIYGTDAGAHPGVAREMSRSPYRVGGAVQIITSEERLFPRYSNTPEQTRKIFKQRGWKTVAGFQTRNPLHRAHEYLQRIALELMDGLFIHPLIGWKKPDDFSPHAVVKAYEQQIKLFYPPRRVLLGMLRTPMRYAGPREAVFHALIRRNYGCTHFIIGRDHAGVGNYYGKYAAQKLSRDFNNLGIEILELCGPYYCRKCGTVVTEKTCPHGEQHAVSISGTQMRALFAKRERPPEEYMRPEISAVLLRLYEQKKLFCGDAASEFSRNR